MQRIDGVDKGSIAEELGVTVGDTLIAMNGTPVLDVVDYEYLQAEERLILSFLQPDGGRYEAEVEKEAAERLGLRFATGLMSEVRACRNKCVFCFIDQMPPHGRDTLYFKDDDWRMSFIMGNYITLTNVDEAEFERILTRKAGPLYISVHATDPDVRARMMRNPTAGNIRERLQRLYDSNIAFHSQIVCCPGLNDGEVLQKTLEDLYALYPYAASVAIVPVGLTKYRNKLYPLHTFTKEEAREALSLIEAFAEKCKRECGNAFAFASDEFVLAAGEELPPYEAYEDFGQIENGVGLLRLFERDFMDALEEYTPCKKEFRFDVAGGTLAHPFMERVFERLWTYGIHAYLHAVRNDFFGPNITVGGLLTGQDLVRQLSGKLKTGKLFLPHNMLREQEDVFLDGMRVEALANTLGVQVIPVRGDGEAWIRAIFDMAREEKHE